MRKEVKHTIELVNSQKFEEAFTYGYENGVLVSEDWIERDGKEYYMISVEDDVFYFDTDEID